MQVLWVKVRETHQKPQNEVQGHRFRHQNPSKCRKALCFPKCHCLWEAAWLCFQFTWGLWLRPFPSPAWKKEPIHYAGFLPFAQSQILRPQSPWDGRSWEAKLGWGRGCWGHGNF